MAGVSIYDLKNDFGLDDNDLNAYMPIKPERMKAKKIEVTYLGYYLKCHAHCIRSFQLYSNDQSTVH